MTDWQREALEHLKAFMGRWHFFCEPSRFPGRHMVGIVGAVLDDDQAAARDHMKRLEEFFGPFGEGR